MTPHYTRRDDERGEAGANIRGAARARGTRESSVKWCVTHTNDGGAIVTSRDARLATMRTPRDVVDRPR
jgi:hypothetical protein